MENMIIIILLAGIIGGVVFYLHKAKKRGEHCIGCPYAKQCAKQQKEHCSTCQTPVA